MIVSIIIPIYNVAPYVEQCLQSVVSQTSREGIECILVDDCGTDDSMIICERFVAHYDGPIQFRIIYHEYNRGVSAARNTGIINARGEWIFFIDSDDWIYNNCIGSLLTSAKKYPKAEIIQGTFYAEDKEINNWLHSKYVVPTNTDFFDDSGRCRIHFQKIGCLAVVHNRLIKKSFVINNHLFFKEGIRHEDNLWTFMAGKYIRYIAFCKTETLFYRSSPNGYMSSANDEIQAKYFSVICDEIFNNITLGKWFNLELNYLQWRILSIEKYTYKDPFILMQSANNKIVRKLYEMDKLSDTNQTRYTNIHIYKRCLYKCILYLNILYKRLFCIVS